MILRIYINLQQFRRKDLDLQIKSIIEYQQKNHRIIVHEMNLEEWNAFIDETVRCDKVWLESVIENTIENAKRKTKIKDEQKLLELETKIASRPEFQRKDCYYLYLQHIRNINLKNLFFILVMIKLLEPHINTLQYKKYDIIIEMLTFSLVRPFLSLLSFIKQIS